MHVAQPTDAGVGGYVAALAADHLARGWRVVVACPEGGRLPGELDRCGVPRMAWPARRSPGPATLAEARRLNLLVERVRPDVVHLHSAKAGLAGRLAVRGGVPTLFQPHGWSWLAVSGAAAQASLAWERLASRWTELFVLVGTGEAGLARDAGVVGRQVVVRTGVDLQRFRPAGRAARSAARARLGVDRHLPLAVCLGRVCRQKGQDLLLAAWPRVRQHCPEAELAVVGDGEVPTGARGRALPGVRFSPEVLDPRPWYAAADLVVLPSRWEGLALTVLEALAVGRSVVVSDVAGLAEVVTERVGAVVPAGDPDALATAIATRLAHRRRTEAEGRAAAALAAAEFDLRRTWDRLAVLTEQTAQQPQQPQLHQPAQLPQPARTTPSTQSTRSAQRAQNAQSTRSEQPVISAPPRCVSALARLGEDPLRHR